MPRARAQELPEFALEWDADPSCPDRAWAEEKLRDRLGRPLSPTPAASLHVAARLRRKPGGYTLSMITTRSTGDQGTRSLSDARCDELAQAAILVIALAVEDQREERPTASPAAAPTPSPPFKAPVGRDGAQAQPLSDHPPSLALRLSGMVDVGFLPQVGVGPEWAIALVRTRGRVELSGFWLPFRVSEPDPGGRVAVATWALRPAGCIALWRSEGDALGADVCLGLELGRTRARGNDLSERKEPSWLFRSAWAALRITGQLSPHWAWVLTPGLAVPLGRPSYVSETTGPNAPPVSEPARGVRTELHTPAPVSARLSLGVETRF